MADRTARTRVRSRRTHHFTQEPAERPYGVEAIMRDDSGNWYSFTQHKFLEGKP